MERTSFKREGFATLSNSLFASAKGSKILGGFRCFISKKFEDDSTSSFVLNGDVKEIGNQYFKKQEFATAAEKYTKALRYLAEPGDDEKDEKDIEKLKGVYYLNRAACYLKTKQNTRALQDCEDVLKIDKNNVKGFFRRAQAQIELKEFDSAILDLKKVLELDPSNQPAQAELKKIEARVVAYKKQQQKAYASLFSSDD